MQTSALPSSYTEFGDLAKLKTASIDNPQKALESVARQFEALFTQMIFKSMRNAELSSGLFDNNQTKMYQDILDKQLSTSLSSQKGLGIADLLISQLSRTQNANVASVNSVKNTTSSESAVKHVSKIQLDGNNAGKTEFSNPAKFVETLYPVARKLENEYQIPARSLLAQSALETGWGKHIIHDNNGVSSFNLFGIKANDDWHGKVVSASTTEYISGQPITKYERFRAYDSFKDSMVDYAKHISSDPRYEAAYRQRAEPEKYFIGLQMAGYATDPDYSSKINKILDGISVASQNMT